MNRLLSDAATASAHYPDPQVRDQVALAMQALEDVPHQLATWREELAQNRTLASCLQLDTGHIARCRQLAGKLCDDSEFLLALPLALCCATYAPDEPDHSFLAGTCLQRLDDPASAAHFYRVALQRDAGDAASAYRLGECLERLGQGEDAAHLYHWAIELARGNFALRNLQDMASRRLAQVHMIRRGCHPHD